MSRSAVPSLAQQEILLECLEEQRWLATGYARTSHARDRTRAAWQDIASKLNSDGQGCIKSSQQWAKYWKDKKSSVKKKYSQICIARQQTGGGAAEEIVLSAIEDRILALMGGERFARGDRHLEINPFVEPNTNQSVPAAISPETQGGIQLVIQDYGRDSDTVSESILQAHIASSMAVEPGTAGSVVQRRLEFEPTQQQQQEHVLASACTPGCPTEPAAPAPASASRVPSATSSPRRRRLVARRRVVRRSPPSQRQSQMANLTERFIAIEEQRVATEQMLAQNQRELINVLREMSEAWSRQSQALQEIVNKMNS